MRQLVNDLNLEKSETILVKNNPEEEELVCHLKLFSTITQRTVTPEIKSQ